MKRIARLLGGALILLVMIVALVSCDDLLLPGGQQGGPLDGLLDGLLDGVPEIGDFDFPAAPPDAREAAEQAIQRIQQEMARITGELDQAEQRTANIQELPEMFDDLMDDLGTVMDAYEEEFYPGMEVFSFGLFDENSLYIEDNDYIEIDEDAAISGFRFSRTFTNEMDQAYMEISIGVNVEFEITGLGDEINGKYRIELLVNAAGEFNADMEEDMTLLGTLTNLNNNDEQPLTQNDYLHKWNQEGAQPRQKILTLFMEYLVIELEESATQIFYPEVDSDDLNGEFRFGLVSFYDEAGDDEEEDVPIYLSFLWEGPDNEEYYVVYSTHEDYEEIVAINGVAYEFIPK